MTSMTSTEANAWRRAQANRLIRFCQAQGVDPRLVMDGATTIDLSPIEDEHGQIVPEQVDLDASQHDDETTIATATEAAGLGALAASAMDLRDDVAAFALKAAKMAERYAGTPDETYFAGLAVEARKMASKFTTAVVITTEKRIDVDHDVAET